jgi:putative oxidoreductase
MERLSRYHAEIYAALRVVAGVLFACHGAQKTLGWLGGFAGEPGATAPLQSLVGAAGIIELVGGLLIAIGLLTRPVAFLCSGQMAVAYFMAHAPKGFWPVQNEGELAVVYAFLFLFVSAHGAGAYSVDSARAHARTPALPLDPRPV